MFDHSFLPPVRCEFVVIADTHYMIDPTGQQVEFTSRRRQTARAEQALRLVAGITAGQESPLVIHMGDLIQEFPERPNFTQARAEALAQLARHNVQPHFVAGNHDVGDKPDPTMPASWVTADFLADYHARFGRSWYSWRQDELSFIVLNSQIMNGALPEAATQQAWLEDELPQHNGQRIFLFLHLPPFLHDELEPDLGHYDNLAEPARGWLLNLVRRHRVERVFAAHVHWAFYNQIGETRYQTIPSVAFTRPGFSELFSSAPPAEQGRDDVAKLGFFLVRVHEQESRVHFIRTSGQTEQSPSPRLITGTSADLPHSPLGLTALHPIAPVGQVPAAWPSTIRQPVRNDYGLLQMLELGVRHLRVPAADLREPVQSERLVILRGHGVQVTAQWLWSPGLELTRAVAPFMAQLDGIELQVLGDLWPTADALAQLQHCVAAHHKPVTLSCVVPGQNIPGKQHGRSQIGYMAVQLAKLNEYLAAAGVHVDRVCCHWPLADDANTADFASLPACAQIGAIDWLYGLPATAEMAQANGAAAALFQMLNRPGDRLFVEPYVDFDRTMDSGLGLLDRCYNPRPAFHVLRHLNTLLFGASAEGASVITTTEYEGYRQLSDGQRLLILPNADSEPVQMSANTVSALRDMQLNKEVGLCSGSTQKWADMAVSEPSIYVAG
ncbi:MAG: metallophosphoesterase [Caldilineaceae bacterium]